MLGAMKFKEKTSFSRAVGIIELNRINTFVEG